MGGHLIAIYSSKGGVGKSFLAANLAVDLHMDTRARVLLIDFGLPFSNDIKYILNLTDTKSIDNLLPMAGKLNPAMLKGYATPHPSGIFVLSLSSGHRQPDPEQLSGANIERVMRLLRAIYDYVIVDIGTKFDSLVEPIFELSSRILLPVTPDFLSIRQTVDDLELLRNRNFSREAIRVVINRYDKTASVSPEMISHQLNKQTVATIPLDPENAANLAQGTYPEKFPRHPVTQAIDKLVYTLFQELKGKTTGDDGRLDAHEALPQDLDTLKRTIHEKLLESIDFKKIDMGADNDPGKMDELKTTVSHKISEILDNETTFSDRSLRLQIVKEVLQEAIGLGPLEDILSDNSVSEIMVNAWNEIYVERKGRLERINKKFFSEKHLLNIITRITAPLGRKIDTSTPMVDARLKDGSRVNAIISPLAVRGACLTIRKFPEDQIVVDDLVSFNTLNQQMVAFLKAAVLAKLNILISGGTGSGKTTLLNILSSFIPETERIVTIEDSAELKLRQPHVVTLESRPPNIEGKGEVTIRDLVKNSLRMRPDRIVVGECRSAEALDMLQAMNTGHDGSLTTIHSNSSREALSRLETLVMYAGFELPVKAIKEQIVGAIDLIVQISRFKDGSRKIIQISEVDGMQGEVITLGDVFLFKQSGEDKGRVMGDFSSTGYIPRCLERFTERGIHIPREIFWTSN
ncbi:MAG: pilus assembly protein TadA [Desulfobacteraceae bacterium]|nr:MAG: pilus assembly protein TadA [Desulfobacteraceae bacterium]